MNLAESLGKAVQEGAGETPVPDPDEPIVSDLEETEPETEPQEEAEPEDPVETRLAQIDAAVAKKFAGMDKVLYQHLSKLGDMTKNLEALTQRLSHPQSVDDYEDEEEEYGSVDYAKKTYDEIRALKRQEEQAASARTQAQQQLSAANEVLEQLTADYEASSGSAFSMDEFSAKAAELGASGRLKPEMFMHQQTAATAFWLVVNAIELDKAKNRPKAKPSTPTPRATAPATAGVPDTKPVRGEGLAAAITRSHAGASGK